MFVNDATRSLFAVLVLMACSAAASLVLTPLVGWVAWRTGVVDSPGGRKIHATPVPRVGGVGVMLALALTLTVSSAAGNRLVGPTPMDSASTIPLLAGGLVAFLIGLLDDVWPVASGLKLLAQLAAATIVVASDIRVERITLLGAVLELGALSVPLTVLWIVVVTNAFNLMDGLDGLAAGLAVIAATSCATALIIRGYVPEGLVLVTLVGALAGFLPYNFSPARVFLGDSGSLFCGFVLAVTAITGRQKGVTALAVAEPLLIFALPLADTSWSIVRRLLSPAPSSNRFQRLRRVLQADRAHIHHRLLTLGLSHRAAVLVLYLVSAGLSLLALLLMEPS
jgi:UDP-GlcNAc:undecaprenyl-phosphate GlcNAc-1-phosphate transferase